MYCDSRFSITLPSCDTLVCLLMHMSGVSIMQRCQPNEIKRCDKYPKKEGHFQTWR